MKLQICLSGRREPGVISGAMQTLVVGKIAALYTLNSSLNSFVIHCLNISFIELENTHIFTRNVSIIFVNKI